MPMVGGSKGRVWHGSPSLPLLIYFLPPPRHTVHPSKGQSGPSPRLMRCNSSASTEAEMLFQGLLPHTHSPTGSSFRSLFPTPSGLHSRFQSPMRWLSIKGKGGPRGGKLDHG